ncbi:hypothetical protein [Microcella sp.]|uniref:hypothetical protein n=1 Tax=Microcella sp. TaxID=1913979 RepID=UPI00391C5060
MPALPPVPSRTDALRILDRSEGDLVVNSAHLLLVSEELKKLAPSKVSRVIDQIDDSLLAARRDVWPAGWGYFAQVAVHLDARELDAVALVMKHHELVAAGLWADVRPRQIAIQLSWM